MSHFVVLVIGDDPESQLDPYHEFECTGRVDEWVEDVDVTEAVRSEFESSTQEVVVFPDGTRVSKFDDRFFRYPTEEEQEKLGKTFGSGFQDGIYFVSKDWGDGRGYQTKVNDPTIGGGELVTLPMKELVTLPEYCVENCGKPVVLAGCNPDLEGKHKWGWTKLDEQGELIEVIRRTNPNKKWDWWVLGGRWAGYFTLKDGSKSDNPLWGEVDLEAMQKEAEANARSAFQRWKEVYQEHGATLSWLECLEKFQSHEEARAFYGSQGAIQAYRAKVGDFRCPVQTFGFDEEAYVSMERKSVLVPFAVLREGEWYERGAMGWWGMVANEKEGDFWVEEVLKLLEGLSPDTRVSAIDCHI